VHPPSVDTLARSLAQFELPQALRVSIARQAIAEAVDAQDPASSSDRAHVLAAAQLRQLLQPVINATGTLLHTNLGRAPRLAPTKPHTDQPIRYTSLEFDLASGQRGSRRTHASSLLALLSGAEAGLVVNNCAAAMLLVVSALAGGRGVAVSRGEMVEIGGGFRIPDVMEQGGARLVEVGTTNRTRLADYEKVIGSPKHDVAMLLKVHQSNYRITGFTEETSIRELAELAAQAHIPFVADIGSGLLDTRLPWLADKSGKVPALPWLANEPGARQTIELGTGLAVFSGDKLLGGPQAGIIVGSADLVEKCARHPLARAVRPGGMVLDELQRVALVYLDQRARELPFWRMACISADDLRTRADHIVDSLTVLGIDASSVETMSVPGGGTLPDREIPSFGVCLARDLVRALRFSTIPIVARMTASGTVLDLRTVDPADDEFVTQAIAKASTDRTSDK
jgi:L-seryl-tRNA(Ser) seleniumtransferase